MWGLTAHRQVHQGPCCSSSSAHRKAGNAQRPGGWCQAGSGDGRLHLQSLSREQVRDSDGVTISAGGVVAQICCHSHSSALQRLESWVGLDTLVCPAVPLRHFLW